MDLHGYASREELIRDHWKRYRIRWNASESPRWKIPVRHRQYPYMPPAKQDGPPQFGSDLEFSFERGALDGRAAYRITCEGHVVEEAPL